MADLLFSHAAGIARITINRPDKRNALSFEVMTALRDALAAAAADDEVRVVVITGAGEKAFCSGADLGSTMGVEGSGGGAGSDPSHDQRGMGVEGSGGGAGSDPSHDQRGMGVEGSGGGTGGAGGAGAHDARGALADVFRAMWGMGKPTIARVRGYALAGGFGLAMACDLVVASDDSVFGTPEINVGLWPHMITVPLLRSLPGRVVLELMTTGRRVGPDELARFGAVNRVVPAADLDAAVDELASTIALKSPIALRYGLRGFRRAQEMGSDEALDLLQALLTVTTHTEDATEGVMAFVEKRAPVWKGR